MPMFQKVQRTVEIRQVPVVDRTVDVLVVMQRQVPVPRYAESSAVHNFAQLRQSLEDRSTQDSSGFASSLLAEKADLVEAEKSLAAVVIAQSHQSSDKDDGVTCQAVQDGTVDVNMERQEIHRRL